MLREVTCGYNVVLDVCSGCGELQLYILSLQPLSLSYFCSVVDAFRSGAYDGKTYSGSYGDLGVTIAAILLHPEPHHVPVGRKV